MNSLERVLAALQNQPADRPAFLLNASLYGARLTGASLRDHYNLAETYAEGQMAVREAFAPDLLISPFMVPALGEAFGSRASLPRHQAPNISEFAADSAEAALHLPMPDVDSHPRILYLRECIQILSRKYAGEVPIIGVLVSPMDLPPLIIGLEAWLDALLFQPNIARALIDRLTPFFVSLGAAMLGDGATALALTANLANRYLVPGPVVEGICRPALQQALGELSGPVILHHGGCPLLPNLGDFKGFPHVAGFLLDAGEDLAAARNLLGPGPLLLGNLDGPGLLELHPDAIRARCEELLALRNADLQIILATGNADIQLDTPPECIRAITDAVCRVGQVRA